ncbi:MAG: hypothetical protein DWQ29_24435 [Planctomycetota bacterium]|nr:MAG: hypothetical protein DWQ29_24435 [Planctomycetota bacterium]
MPYFNRLTDIVTCSLTNLLNDADDPQAALAEIIAEIREGVAGAERSSRTAARNVERMTSEIEEQGREVTRWVEAARQHLEEGQEDQARQSLLRKREVEDLIAALEEQRRAAEATHLHLQTTLSALQARLADAARRLSGLQGEAKEPEAFVTTSNRENTSSDPRMAAVEAELSELRKSLRKS